MNGKRTFQAAASAAGLLIILLWLGPIPVVKADIAPPPPPEAGSISPGQGIETYVRMEAETVLVDITPAKGQGAPSAQVTARFLMRNQGAQAETMDVRFPLNLLYPHYQSDLEVCPYPEGGFPQINDFTAQVDGQPVNVTTVAEKVGNPDLGQTILEVPCWATFPVTFPPGEEVKIEVGYTADGYFSWDADSLVEFPYVLVTGAGWDGTIGSADITIRAPYELNNLNLFGYSPDDGEVSGREVRWRFTDLEPEWNISATIVNPQLWAKIEKERRNVANDPSYGEAWGRLGKAYKEANSTRRGMRWDEGGPELYQLSREAYEKALELLPKDADWHFGYADLLWRNVQYGSFGTYEEQRDDLVKAVEHLRRTLAINPRHARALETLEEIATWWMWDTDAPPAVDLSGAKPDFLILTTTPTVRPLPTDIPTNTPWPSPTMPPTSTEPALAAPTVVSGTEVANIPATEEGPALQTPEVGQNQPSPTPDNQGGGGGLCGIAAIPLFGLAAVLIGFRRRKRS